MVVSKPLALLESFDGPLFFLVGTASAVALFTRIKTVGLARDDRNPHAYGLHVHAIFFVLLRGGTKAVGDWHTFVVFANDTALRTESHRGERWGCPVIYFISHV